MYLCMVKWMICNIYALDSLDIIQDFMAPRGRTYKVNWHYYAVPDACIKRYIVH